MTLDEAEKREVENICKPAIIERRAGMTPPTGVNKYLPHTATGIGSLVFALVISYGQDIVDGVDEIKQKQIEQTIQFVELKNDFERFQTQSTSNRELIDQVWARLRNMGERTEILKRELDLICRKVNPDNPRDCTLQFPSVEAF